MMIAHLARVCLGWDQPETQVTSRELSVLKRYAAEAGVIVELGTFEGATSIALAAVTKGSVHTFDPFFRGRLGICYSELIVHLLKWRHRARNVNIRRAFGHEAAGEFQSPVDLLFIDADHSYQAVRQDWDSWFGKVAPNGVIALHDCRPAPNSPNRLGTWQFYSEDIPRMQGVQEIEAVDSLVVLRKSGEHL